MLIKTIVSIVLSLTIISCFADSGGNDSRPLIDTQKKMQSSSTQNNSQSQSIQSSTSSENGTTQSVQDSDTKEKPSMADYCREHVC
jgi:hypothetical protein